MQEGLAHFIKNKLCHHGTCIRSEKFREKFIDVVSIIRTNEVRGGRSRALMGLGTKKKPLPRGHTRKGSE